jgi:hypothetical protein
VGRALARGLLECGLALDDEDLALHQLVEVEPPLVRVADVVEREHAAQILVEELEHELGELLDGLLRERRAAHRLLPRLSLVQLDAVHAVRALAKGRVPLVERGRVRSACARLDLRADREA